MVPGRVQFLMIEVTLQVVLEHAELETLMLAYAPIDSVPWSYKGVGDPV